MCSTFVYSKKKDNKHLVDAKYECRYSIQYINDTIKMTNGREDWFILKIGNDLTYGYSYLDYYRADSLFYQVPEGRGIQMLVDSYLEGVKNGTVTSSNWNSSGLYYAKLYKDYREKKVKVLDNISVHWFIYEEELIPQNWIIRDDTATIAGYACQKAVCDYRGRSYEAWFTPEIPISEGPWKFYGLPGLIVKLYDTKYHYDFELVNIKAIEEKIDTQVLSTRKMIRIGSPKLTEIERKEFLRAKFGEKGEMISNMELAKVGLSSSSATEMNYDYIKLDYK